MPPSSTRKSAKGDTTFRVVMLKAPESLKHKEVAMPLKELEETSGLKLNVENGVGWAPVCTWYTLGNCRNGKDCRYIHPQWHLIEKYGWKGVAPHCEPEVRARILARGETPGPPSAAAATPVAGSAASSAAPTPTKALAPVMRPLSTVDQLHAVLRTLADDRGMLEPTRSDVAQEWVAKFNMREKSARSQAIDDAVAAGTVRATGTGADARLALVRHAAQAAGSESRGTGDSSPAVAAFAARLRQYFGRYDVKRVPDALKLAEANSAREAAMMKELCARYGPENETEVLLSSAAKGAAAATTSTKNAWGVSVAPASSSAVSPIAAAAAEAKPAGLPPAAATGAWGKTTVWGGTASAAAARAAMAEAPALDGVAPRIVTVADRPEASAVLRKSSAREGASLATTAPQRNPPATATSTKTPSAKPSQKPAPKAPVVASEAAPTSSEDDAETFESTPDAESAAEALAPATAAENPAARHMDAVPHDPWGAVVGTPAGQLDGAGLFPATTTPARTDAWDPFGPASAASNPFEAIASSAGTTPTTAGEPAFSRQQSAFQPPTGNAFGAAGADGPFSSTYANGFASASHRVASHRGASHEDGDDYLAPSNPWGAAADDAPAAPETGLFSSPGRVGQIRSLEGFASNGITAAMLLDRLQRLKLGATLSSRLDVRELAHPPSTVVCCLCRGTMVEPVEVLPCRHLYCRRCLVQRCEDQQPQSSATCRFCVNTTPVTDVLPSSRDIVEAIDAVMVECMRCTWTGPRGDHAGHGCDPRVNDLRTAAEKAQFALRRKHFAEAATCCRDALDAAAIDLDEATKLPESLKDSVLKLLVAEVESLLEGASPVAEAIAHYALKQAQRANAVFSNEKATALYWLGRANQATHNDFDAIVSYSACQKADKEGAHPDVAERLKGFRTSVNSRSSGVVPSAPPPYTSPQASVTSRAAPAAPPPMPSSTSPQYRIARNAGPMPSWGYGHPHYGGGGMLAHHHHLHHHHHGQHQQHATYALPAGFRPPPQHHHHLHGGHAHHQHPGFHVPHHMHHHHHHTMQQHHHNMQQHLRGAPFMAPGGKTIAQRPRESSPPADAGAQVQFRSNAVNAPSPPPAC